MSDWLIFHEEKLVENGFNPQICERKVRSHPADSGAKNGPKRPFLRPIVENSTRKL